ncbi:hypothetical protein DQ04_02301060 [Trypanosoma grayi]|uniref:hypothetical protein n=1 Tax=Trypanosoma grayi TaxID=71804 RepID=UPI0004F45CC5|nr:hypothetical protein DQ04_02301060 [Trypanosoma grayi]KEG11767.1 hypothetical protein DQ04_02301060 [Trypanosoma grayi]
MGFDFVFFKAIDRTSLEPAGLACVVAELLAVTLFSVVVGVLLRVLPPWWAKRSLPRRAALGRKSRTQEKHVRDNTASIPTASAREVTQEDDSCNPAAPRAECAQPLVPESTSPEETPTVVVAAKAAPATSGHEKEKGEDEEEEEEEERELSGVSHDMKASQKDCVPLDDVLDEFFGEEQLLEEALLGAAVGESVEPVVAPLTSTNRTPQPRPTKTVDGSAAVGRGRVVRASRRGQANGTVRSATTITGDDGTTLDSALDQFFHEEQCLEEALLEGQ